MKDTLLKLENINTFYGSAQVHFDLSITVSSGHIVSLLGGNASGKSTTMKIILGLVKPQSGKITLDKTDITNWKTPQIVGAGVGSVPEARRLFPAMSVKENLLMGAYLRKDRTQISNDLERILDIFPRIGQRINHSAGTLSGGEQQMVAMARALMGKPRLICMDEPTMGLSPLFVDRVLDMISDIRNEGVSVFMVEQNAGLALQIADYGYVLQTGKIALSGTANQLLHDPRVQDAYLGGTVLNEQTKLEKI